MKEYERLVNKLFEPEKPDPDFLEMLAEIDEKTRKIKDNRPGMVLRSSQTIALAYVVWRLLQ